MRILHLTLKKKWFDMIASGEKTEEYREIKPYWDSRLLEKQYDLVVFKNGYHKKAPILKFYIKAIVLAQGKSEWGAEKGLYYYVIKLGQRIQ